MHHALIKKKNKFSSYIGKFWVEQLQSHIWLTASSYMTKYLRISSYIRKPFLIYDFATASLWIPLYMRNIFFSFVSVRSSLPPFPTLMQLPSRDYSILSPLPLSPHPDILHFLCGFRDAGTSSGGGITILPLSLGGGRGQFFFLPCTITPCCSPSS
jgi:hypothetical protein